MARPVIRLYQLNAARHVAAAPDDAGGRFIRRKEARRYTFVAESNGWVRFRACDSATAIDLYQRKEHCLRVKPGDLISVPCTVCKTSVQVRGLRAHKKTNGHKAAENAAALRETGFNYASPQALRGLTIVSWFQREAKAPHLAILDRNLPGFQIGYTNPHSPTAGEVWVTPEADEFARELAVLYDDAHNLAERRLGEKLCTVFYDSNSTQAQQILSELKAMQTELRMLQECSEPEDEVF